MSIRSFQSSEKNTNKQSEREIFSTSSGNEEEGRQSAKILRPDGDDGPVQIVGTLDLYNEGDQDKAITVIVENFIRDR